MVDWVEMKIAFELVYDPQLDAHEVVDPTFDATWNLPTAAPSFNGLYSRHFDPQDPEPPYEVGLFSIHLLHHPLWGGDSE